MGLTVHSLGEFPANVERNYYVYLLDYGWQESVSDAMYTNFPKMADLASRNNAVVSRGTQGRHFADEVLSWHHINGQDAEAILPAILVTTKHPRQFREHGWNRKQTDRLLLIPLRHVCKSAADVTPLIQKLFKDIQENRALTDFDIAEEIRAGDRGALLDALILKPSLGGFGVDINRIIQFFRERKSSSLNP